MGFLADKNVRLLANINTVGCAGLTVALPKKPSASLQGLSNWKTNG